MTFRRWRLWRRPRGTGPAGVCSDARPVGGRTCLAINHGWPIPGQVLPLHAHGGVPPAGPAPGCLGSSAMSGLLRPVGPAPIQTYWARRALVFGAVATVLAIAVVLIISRTSSGSAAQPSPPADAYSVGSSPTSTGPAKSQAKSLDEAMVPESGPGTYQAAEKTVTSKSSYGALIRYDVRVEDGLSIDPDKAAVLIQRVLDDKRSWRATRRWRFELTPVGQPASLHAYIVTPETTDRLCAPYLTRGEVSCQNGNRVVLNAKRWLLGADSYGSDLTDYPRYLVNHEFGHALGKHHVDCPGPGRPAPVMMQQTKGLGACRKNPWPQISEH
jgi:Protein of unknown function (DUF3152)